MNLSRVTAYGVPGVVALGAGAIWAQSLIVWVAQPSHLIVVGGIVATAAAAKAVGRGKVKAEPAPQAQEPSQETLAAQAQNYLDSLRVRELPRPAQVIGYTAAGQEVTRTHKRTV